MAAPILTDEKLHQLITAILAAPYMGRVDEIPGEELAEVAWHLMRAVRTVREEMATAALKGDTNAS